MLGFCPVPLLSSSCAPPLPGARLVGSRFAYISARSSAFCDEIVEVLGKLDNQDLALIRNGSGLFWTPTSHLEPALAPASCPYRLANVREFYRELIGAYPPPTARSGLVWAAVLRKLQDTHASEPISKSPCSKSNCPKSTCDASRSSRRGASDVSGAGSMPAGRSLSLQTRRPTRSKRVRKMHKTGA